MHVLDTDILTLAHAGHAKVKENIEQAGEDDVATTVISAIEILRGRHEFLLKASDGQQLLRAQSLLNKSETLLQTIQIIPVDGGAAEEFDKLRLTKKLGNIGRDDLLIACISLSHGATLVTRNLKHFRQVPGLTIKNWAD